MAEAPDLCIVGGGPADMMRMQRVVQDRVIAPIPSGRTMSRPPLVARLLDAVPLFRRIPARIIRLGFRPEHVRSPAR